MWAVIVESPGGNYSLEDVCQEKAWAVKEIEALRKLHTEYKFTIYEEVDENAKREPFPGELAPDAS